MSITSRNHLRILFSLTVLTIFIMSTAIINAYTYPFQDPSLSTDTRVNDLVSRLTLAEKISQMGNTAPAISRLGIASYQWWNECLHGVCGSPSSVFPQAIALSSTWDPALVNSVAGAISDEARVKNNTEGKGLTYWSPVINIARDPRWGRAEENYGEDPYLCGQLAVNYVKGLQGNDPKYLKTVSTPKHFACNNSEFNRHTGSAGVDERNLREYYLPAFKASVVDGKAFSVMSAYNSVNGVPCSANSLLLNDILRNEWGFQGYVVSDCDAIYDIWASHHYVATAPEAAAIGVKGGCDLNCGGTYQDSLNTAITNGLLTQADIDIAVKRLFKARILLGEFDPPSMVPYTSIPASEVNCQEHQNIALQAAREAIVLLKNSNNTLPFNKTTLNSIAVIGPNADTCQIGGYSGTPLFSITPLKGIETKFGVTAGDPGTVYEAENYSSQSGIQTEPCSEGGLNVGYIENGDYTVYNNVDFTGKTGFAARVASNTSGGNLEVRLDSLTGTLVCTLAVPGTGGWQNWITKTSTISGVTGVHNLYLKFTGGSGNLFNVNWFKVTYPATPGAKTITYAQGCSISGAKVQADFDKAVNAARNSDIAIMIMGTDTSVSSEEHDRSSIDLPGVQEELIQAVYQANPRTVVVLISGFSLAVNWTAANVPALLSAWYDGQSQGTAIADVLFGDYNPGGKLTTTWYKYLTDLPDINDYNVRHNRTYLYFTGAPLYPFGYGLSYTSFAYSNLRISSGTIAPGGTITVSADVKNTGTQVGDEVAQLYVRDVSSSVQRPIKELKGFQRITLQPNETKTVTFSLPYDALAFYDVYSKQFVVENGAFDLMVGASSSDIRLSGQTTATGGINSIATTAFTTIEAENYSSQSGVAAESCAENGLNIGWIENGDYAAYNNVDFGSGAVNFEARVASNANGGNIEIRLDSPTGTLVGSCAVTGTGGWQTWAGKTCSISGANGVHNLYLKFTGGTGYLFNVNWFRFTNIVAIRATINNQYVCADNYGNNPLIANRTTIGQWEKYEKFGLGDGKIALKALANDQFVCADNGGANPLIANRTSIGPWETFQLVDLGSGKVGFIAQANGKYVCADNAGASPLIATRTVAGPWETFEMLVQ
jgi:beta-glucosidase